MPAPDAVHKHHLPRLRAALNAWSETIEDAQVRRIGWAVEELHLRGELIVEWRLRRLAGLRQQCAPYVEAAIREATGVAKARAPDSGVRLGNQGQAGGWAPCPGGIPGPTGLTPTITPAIEPAFDLAGDSEPGLAGRQLITKRTKYSAQYKRTTLKVTERPHRWAK